jgi:hypothetical protein
MFEIIAKPQASNTLKPSVASTGTRITAQIEPLCAFEKLSNGQIKHLLLDFNSNFLARSIPQSGDYLVGINKQHYLQKITDVSIVVSGHIKQSDRVHIDLSEEEPLWINGAPATRTERETTAKALGHSTWRCFAMHYCKHYGYGCFTGFLISL